jgi:hypothetical protein
MNRFGPINGIYGRRRLNVLFTRAKDRVGLFTSMRPGDIKADGGSQPGVHTLKANIYRIWSTDWFQNPAQEFQRLLNHLDRLVREVA